MKGENLKDKGGKVQIWRGGKKTRGGKEKEKEVLEGKLKEKRERAGFKLGNL